MAMYIGEENLWKCSKHTSKRHRTGICPVCLRDRLILLCPECANKLPCPCYVSSSSSASASSSSSFSFFYSRDGGGGGGGGGGRVSDLINRESTFRRSRSVGIPYIFSRFSGDKIVNQQPQPAICAKSSKIAMFLSKFKMNLIGKKRAENEIQSIESKNRFDGYGCKHSNKTTVDDVTRRMIKSRSVHVAKTTSHYAKSPATVKNGRSFQSPMRLFRQLPKGIQSRSSPVCRT